MLPRLPAQVRRYQREIVALRGVNYTDCFSDGDLAQSRNLSTRRWPCLCTRWGRNHLEQYDGAAALTAWEELVVVKGGRLYYGGQDVGAVSNGAKQFAVLNTKLVIWPDKKYLDLQNRTVKPLGASVTGTAAFTKGTLQISGRQDLTGLFSAGDTVTVSGCTDLPANNKDIRVKSVKLDTLTVEENGFEAGIETGSVTIERRIPDLDFICESENRLWGCSNETRTIYASALGDPTNFFTYQGLSTDSYAVAVGSEGDFTGCCRISSAVLFWKERTLHKILGSYPAEYAQYSYSVEGLKAGCHKSLQVINEVLYYMGVSGVHAYSGGTPSRISAGFEGKDFRNAVAGTDGERYYLSVTEGQQSHLFTYDLARGIWLREDETKCTGFARLGDSLYFLTAGGEVWQTRGGGTTASGGEEEIEWEARFTPFYETAAGRKRYSRLTLRMELPRGSWLRAQLRSQNGAWETVGQWTGQANDALTASLPIRRGDKLELRLAGKGPCAVLDVVREFSVESRR